MKLLFGFDGWSQICQILCGFLLVFSFSGEKTFGKLYDAMLLANMIAISIGFICVCITAYYKENKL